MKNISKEIKLIFSKNLGLPINQIKNTLSYVKSDKWNF